MTKSIVQHATLMFLLYTRLFIMSSSDSNVTQRFISKSFTLGHNLYYGNKTCFIFKQEQTLLSSFTVKLKRKGQ